MEGIAEDKLMALKRGIEVSWELITSAGSLIQTFGTFLITACWKILKRKNGLLFRRTFSQVRSAPYTSGSCGLMLLLLFVSTTLLALSAEGVGNYRRSKNKNKTNLFTDVYEVMKHRKPHNSIDFAAYKDWPASYLHYNPGFTRDFLIPGFNLSDFFTFYAHIMQENLSDVLPILNTETFLSKRLWFERVMLKRNETSSTTRSLLNAGKNSLMREYMKMKTTVK
ncbi:unnamed protein product [Protopolystoma xenopodis]|uniref:Uncharacterized protein n=1 Tax=Protopolystoma xenopodis TaxID=117903 RepID=A0A448WNI3_9PLAT|nr:unnamed protein product [Protopolystoma xenopodis]